MYRKFLYSYISDNSLIKKLQGEDENSELLWHEFLNRFSKLILKVIWQFESDYDEVMEKYLQICTKLTNGNFSIIRKFKITGDTVSPKFSTWLVTVVRNLCVDLHRAKHGRKRIPKVISRLSETEQEIFRLYYWKGLSIEEIYRFPRIT